MNGIIRKPRKVSSPTLLHLFSALHFLPKTVHETVIFCHEGSQAARVAMANPVDETQSYVQRTRLHISLSNAVFMASTGVKSGRASHTEAEVYKGESGRCRESNYDPWDLRWRVS